MHRMTHPLASESTTAVGTPTRIIPRAKARTHMSTSSPPDAQVMIGDNNRVPELLLTSTLRQGLIKQAPLRALHQ